MISLNTRHGFQPLTRPDFSIGTMRADEEASGDVLFSDDFLNMPPLFRADVLQELCGLLDREYNRAMDEMRGHGLPADAQQEQSTPVGQESPSPST